MRADWRAGTDRPVRPGAARLMAAVPAAPASRRIRARAPGRGRQPNGRPSPRTSRPVPPGRRGTSAPRPSGSSATPAPPPLPPSTTSSPQPSPTGRYRPSYSVAVTAPALVSEPRSLRRPRRADAGVGVHRARRRPVHQPRHAGRRAAPGQRHHDHRARRPGHARPRPAPRSTGSRPLPATQLDPGQRALVTAFASDPRLLLAGIGPAGSGKTTAMRAYAHVAGAAGIRVIALATSAAAADVLAATWACTPTTCTSSCTSGPAGRTPPGCAAGQPVTGPAAHVRAAPRRRRAHRRGRHGRHPAPGPAHRHRRPPRRGRPAARRRPAALRPSQRGGALRLIAAEAGAAELTTLYRFPDPAEAQATLQVRDGDPAALDWYATAGRIRAGSREAMTDAAYDGWKNDMLAGQVTLMAAATTANVTALSARARADRVSRRAGRARRHHLARRQPRRSRRLDRHPPQRPPAAHCSAAGTGSRTATPGASPPPPRRLADRPRTSAPAGTVTAARRLRRGARPAAVRHHRATAPRAPPSTPRTRSSPPA